jgi:hypothetical protein
VRNELLNLLAEPVEDLSHRVDDLVADPWKILAHGAPCLPAVIARLEPHICEHNFMIGGGRNVVPGL